MFSSVVDAGSEGLDGGGSSVTSSIGGGGSNGGDSGDTGAASQTPAQPTTGVEALVAKDVWEKTNREIELLAQGPESSATTTWMRRALDAEKEVRRLREENPLMTKLMSSSPVTLHAQSRLSHMQVALEAERKAVAERRMDVRLALAEARTAWTVLSTALAASSVALAASSALDPIVAGVEVAIVGAPKKRKREASQDAHYCYDICHEVGAFAGGE